MLGDAPENTQPYQPASEDYDEMLKVGLMNLRLARRDQHKAFDPPVGVAMGCRCGGGRSSGNLACWAWEEIRHLLRFRHFDSPEWRAQADRIGRLMTHA